MISKNNFKKVVPQLREQNKGSLDYKQSSWDTFVGWKKRESNGGYYTYNTIQRVDRVEN